MTELGFVLKVFLLSAVVIAIMQVKIGDRNIEQHSQNWLHSSSLVHVLNSVSMGASKAVTDGYHFVRGEMDSRLGKTEKRTEKKNESFAVRHGIEMHHDLKGSEDSESKTDIKSEL